jgi:hypothetical protein
VWSPDGKYLAILEEDSKAALVEVASGSTWSFDAHVVSWGSGELTFSADSRLLVAAVGDRVKLLDVVSKKHVAEFYTMGHYQMRAALSSDAEQLLVLSLVPWPPISERTTLSEYGVEFRQLMHVSTGPVISYCSQLDWNRSMDMGVCLTCCQNDLLLNTSCTCGDCRAGHPLARSRS